MALHGSGAISLDQIDAEFGGWAGRPKSLSEFYRNNSKVYSHWHNRNIPTGGTISFSSFHGAEDEILVDLYGDNYQFNMQSWYNNTYGAPGGPVKIRFRNFGRLLNNYDTWCLYFGDWPSGGEIAFENHSEILGYGGRVPGGEGGNCVHVVGSGGTRRLYNYGNIYGGGGGGGNGGTGGRGKYYTYSWSGNRGSGDPCWNDCDCSCKKYDIGYGTRPDPNATVYWNFGANTCTYSGCNRKERDTHYTWGGGGGGGGQGRGWNTGPTQPGGGAPGGTNAGAGGSGGWGGEWGNWGAAGANGQNGNYTDGTGGTGGGAPGHYLYGHGYLATWHSPGGLAGRLA